MAKNTAAGGPQTVVVNCQAQRLETGGAGAAFRGGLVYPSDVICYSPPVLETVQSRYELRMLLARLGIEDRDEVIGDAETVAPSGRALCFPQTNSAASQPGGWLMDGGSRETNITNT